MSCGSYTGTVPSLGCCGPGQICIAPVVTSFSLTDYMDELGSGTHLPFAAGPALQAGWWDLQLSAVYGSFGGLGPGTTIFGELYLENSDPNIFNPSTVPSLSIQNTTTFVSEHVRVIDSRDPSACIYPVLWVEFQLIHQQHAGTFTFQGVFSPNQGP